MPCWELFDEQSDAYKSEVFLPGVPVISIEAGSTIGWSKYAHASIGIDGWGHSGPYKDVYAKLGITTEKLVEKVHQAIAFYSQHPVPILGGQFPTAAKS
jgi:transketolase